jgi:hypothetical protein
LNGKSTTKKIKMSEKEQQKIETLSQQLQIKVANVTIHTIVEAHRLLERGEKTHSEELIKTLDSLKQAVFKGEFETKSKADEIWENLTILNPKLKELSPEKL